MNPQLYAKITEAEFQAAVIELAQVHRWLVAHFRPSEDKHGRWRTAVAADGKGFPDLVLAHRERGVLFVELKRESERLRPEQVVWGNVLTDAGARFFVWRPSNWPQIETILKGTS